MKRTVIMCLAVVLLFMSCSVPHDQDEIPDTLSVTSENTQEFPNSEPSSENGALLPESNEDLFSMLLEAWQDGDVSEYYKYVSSELSSFVEKNEFVHIFNDLTNIYGEIQSIEKSGKKPESGFDVFSFKTVFENAYAEMTVSIIDLKISGITNDVRITNTFEKKYENGITERYFVLKSNDYDLNAVYTFSDKGVSPAVLLLPGSGPADINETVGLLKPFGDMAIDLAADGINSLRVEKRTYRYADRFTSQDGLKEEYYDDFTIAYDWLKSQKETQNIYLLGHSLGGQITVELSKMFEVDGLILWNSSPRHLSEIAADQYISADKGNESIYRQYENEAKSATTVGAKGLYYYGLSDYYWASYNEIDTLGTLKTINCPCLIINSRADIQSFPKDIDLWQKALENNDNISIHVFDDQSHFGYVVDASDPSAYYRKNDLPDELISIISGFIINDSNQN